MDQSDTGEDGKNLVPVGFVLHEGGNKTARPIGGCPVCGEEDGLVEFTWKFNDEGQSSTECPTCGAEFSLFAEVEVNRGDE